MPAIGFNAPDEVTPQWIREEHRAGRIKIIGELAPPYAGYSAGDAVYEPFFALAEELDIPIAVHVGSAGSSETQRNGRVSAVSVSPGAKLASVFSQPVAFATGC